MNTDSSQKPRFVHEVSRLNGSNIPELLAMAAGDKKFFWFGLNYVQVVRLDAAPHFAARPLSLSGNWHRMRLESTATAFNGQRWWYVCPECGKRSAAMYWSPDKLACRKCMGLRYQSQYETFSSEFERLCHRVRKERIAIWGPNEPDVEFLMRKPSSFKRPKGMRKKTFRRKLERLQALDALWSGVALRHLNSWTDGE
ncbi:MULTISPECIES: hypothetical protein [Enterobacter]|uniref:hypothetical protein n=1 Tax=Enterobacter TaxID=547 RepID=UPI0004DB43DB|nr:hypothetical protein [Enterobacter sp. EGD-HP1]KFA84425.1 hypothetical protein N037_04465 [Enterobacter sp. EGD-HP1]